MNDFPEIDIDKEIENLSTTKRFKSNSMRPIRRQSRKPIDDSVSDDELIRELSRLNTNQRHAVLTLIRSFTF